VTEAQQDTDERRPGIADALYRAFALSLAATTFVFLFNNYLVFWHGWPGVAPVFGGAPSGGAAFLAWLQLVGYVIPVAAITVFALRNRERPFASDAALLYSVTAYIIAAAFWSTFFIGIVDGVISFLRVEGLLPAVFGKTLAQQLGVSSFRGVYVHLPLMLAAAVVACFKRGLDFIWLSLLVVVAEFQIVIARFIFSYEQAFMGDLVRFWYASCFLLASAYSLVDEGHVRVDVFYARFSEKRKAWTNAVGSMALGVPLCWVILTMGMWTKGSSLASPLLNFEISQSGFGMYVKYLMAGLLVIFALSMAAQFTAYFLESVAVLRRKDTGDDAAPASAAPSHP
jgi:TRAP-type mannitol/chloroaromatic compound transport system permease small subunit